MPDWGEEINRPWCGRELSCVNVLLFAGLTLHLVIYLAQDNGLASQGEVKQVQADPVGKPTIESIGNTTEDIDSISGSATSVVGREWRVRSQSKAMQDMTEASLVAKTAFSTDEAVSAVAALATVAAVASSSDVADVLMNSSEPVRVSTPKRKLPWFASGVLSTEVLVKPKAIPLVTLNLYLYPHLSLTQLT